MDGNLIFNFWPALTEIFKYSGGMVRYFLLPSQPTHSAHSLAQTSATERRTDILVAAWDFLLPCCLSSRWLFWLKWKKKIQIFHFLKQKSLSLIIPYHMPMAEDSFLLIPGEVIFSKMNKTDGKQDFLYVRTWKRRSEKLRTSEWCCATITIAHLSDWDEESSVIRGGRKKVGVLRRCH